MGHGEATDVVKRVQELLGVHCGGQVVTGTKHVARVNDNAQPVFPFVCGESGMQVQSCEIV